MEKKEKLKIIAFITLEKNPEEKKSAFVFMTKASRVQNEGNDNEFLFFDIQFFQRAQKMLPP